MRRIRGNGREGKGKWEGWREGKGNWSGEGKGRGRKLKYGMHRGELPNIFPKSAHMSLVILCFLSLAMLYVNAGSSLSVPLLCSY